ncbi:EAP30-domain-containing protein [Martensiomyces pterosporus]|nr:EAP30-domain-containing protein [Martensiomyces pterosporus]
MRSNLEDFVREHQRDIRNNPVFRVQVQRMCQLIGVDPLASRKGYMAELLGVGDFYCELGVQIIDVCVATRSLNGGLIDLDELRERLVKRRLKGSEPVVEDDIKRAIKQLGPLKGGYKIVTFGDRKMVQSVAREMNPDHSTVLTLAQHTGRFAVEDVRLAFGWDQERINACVDDMLRSGIVWVDDCGPLQPPEFYVPAFFSTNGQRLI